MCGRVKLEGDVSELKIAFRIPPEYPAPNFAPASVPRSDRGVLRVEEARAEGEAALRHRARRPRRHLAGLWENWKSPAEEWVRSFTIVTTMPNALCAEIHNRMPVILPSEAWPIWLGEEPTDADRLRTLLAPYPAEGMTCWPVSTRVGNVKNNDPSLIEPIATT